jgi:hypothetical protein
VIEEADDYGEEFYSNEPPPLDMDKIQGYNKDSKIPITSLIENKYLIGMDQSG